MRHIKENRFHHIEDEFTEEVANKPKKQIFCPACKRPKLLFATEKKALDFIKYNAFAIKNTSGYCPIRAYYCYDCGGWHVTSKDAQDKRNFTKNFLGKFEPKADFISKIGGSFDSFLNNLLLTA